MQQTTFTFLDSYCERAGDAGLWAEPVNAVTNIFFLVAAYLCWRALKPMPSLRAGGDIWVLVLALAAIGIGSGLWHTYATQATMLADVIPITLFINVYLLSAMRRILKLDWAKTGFWFLMYWAVTLTAQEQLDPDTLNGSIMYGPTYLTLGLLTFAVWKRDKTAGGEFIQLLGIFTLSLIFRTVDLWVCAFVPLGTHFLWHTLNAYMLYRFLRVLIRTVR